MGYYVSNIFGIRGGGVFSGPIDMVNFNQRIANVAKDVSDTPFDDWSGCTSGELVATKGSYITIAGIFNYWGYPESSKFASALSKEFGSEVMHMCWDEQTNQVQCQIWLDGKTLLESAESPLGQILRRTA